jgi:hypothetical protein
MAHICDQELSDLLLKKAIIPISRPTDGFVSNMFAVPKSSGGWRPILNLKKLNSFVRYEHFKMEGMESVKYLIRKNDWLVKVDLRDAYFTVPLAAEHQKFVRLLWKGNFYQYRCLPFGLCSAPRVFTKILKPVVAFLRERGIRLVIYLDDVLIMASSKDLVLQHLHLVIGLFTSLGFLVNAEKSVFLPSQEIEFLGVIIDSVSLSFSLPPGKVVKVTHMCEKALRADKISLRHLASIMGHFSWAIPTVAFAQAHYRNLQRLYISESHVAKGNLNRLVSLSATARSDLVWWVNNLESSNGKGIIPNEPDIIIFSDASLSGWGACSDGVTARGPWTLDEQARHINELELLAALYALQIFSFHSSDVSIHLFLDNSTAVSYINKCGGTHSKSLCDLATFLIHWCESRNIQLLAFHLPGSLNFIADRESRTSMDSSDWMLDRQVFLSIRSLWELEIDLFANAWNAQLSTFVSWIPQPLALTTNAFSLCWKRRKCYAFPPFSLIPKCLAKVRKEEATLVLVCPFWPSQTWFPLLLELAVDVPRIIRPHPNLLLSSVREAHPLNNSLILSVWKISGCVSEIELFRKTLSLYCWTPTVLPRFLPTSPPGTIGLAGVLDGDRIPCVIL